MNKENRARGAPGASSVGFPPRAVTPGAEGARSAGAHSFDLSRRAGGSALETSSETGDGFANVKMGIRVGRNRVLTLMPETNLLSPRGFRPDANPHQDESITEAPDLIWGAGTKVFTLNGWPWVFAAVDHFNAECVGQYTCKKGERFARHRAD